MAPPLFAQIRRWVLDRIVQDVPEAVATCEFECRVPRCTHGASTPCAIRVSTAIAPLAHARVVVPFPSVATVRSIAADAGPAMGNASR
jgi:hypothetical protein